MGKRIYAIGIVGTSGSGKSYLTKQLANYFADRVAVFNLDNYYIQREMQPKDVNGHYNFDTPESLDLDRYEKDFFDLLAGKSITQKVYNYNNPMEENPSDRFIEIKPKEFLVAEGIFTFHKETIRSRFDYRIFVESPDELCLERRLKRDFEERGYPASDVHYKFRNHLAPAFKQFVEPMRAESHYIFNNLEDNFKTEFNNLISQLSSIFNSKTQGINEKV